MIFSMRNRVHDWQNGKKERPSPLQLPSAVPFFGKGVRVLDKNYVPQEGFVTFPSKNHETKQYETAYLVHVHCSRVIDALIALMKPLAEEVDVFMESRHYGHFRDWSKYEALDIEQIVAESTLRQFQALLEHDGRMRIALSNRKNLEVQLTEDKTIYCYAPEDRLATFHRVLHGLCIPYNAILPRVDRTNHAHLRADKYDEELEELVQTLGATSYKD